MLKNFQSKIKSIIQLSFLIILISCSFNEEENIGKIVREKVDEGPDQKALGVKVRFIDSSITKAILKAKRSKIFSELKETWLIDSVEVVFLSKHSQKRMSILTCDSALIDDNTNNMFAYGNVLVISDSTGTRLETELLEYNDKKGRLYSDKQVRIENPFEILNGIGFESDLNLKNYRIYKVKGVKKKDE